MGLMGTYASVQNSTNPWFNLQKLMRRGKAATCV